LKGRKRDIESEGERESGCEREKEKGGGKTKISE